MRTPSKNRPGARKWRPADLADTWVIEPLIDDDRAHFTLLQRLGYVEPHADIDDFRRQRPVVRH